VCNYSEATFNEAELGFQNIRTDCLWDNTTIQLSWDKIKYAVSYQYCVGTNETSCDLSDGWVSTSQKANISF
jgi:hypothetical protein